MKNILPICLGIAAIAVVAVFVFKIPANNILLYGAVLLCPLMHIFMIKGMNHGDHAEKETKEDKKCH